MEFIICPEAKKFKDQKEIQDNSVNIFSNNFVVSYK